MLYLSKFKYNMLLGKFHTVYYICLLSVVCRESLIYIDYYIIWILY